MLLSQVIHVAKEIEIYILTMLREWQHIYIYIVFTCLAWNSKERRNVVPLVVELRVWFKLPPSICALLLSYGTHKNSTCMNNNSLYRLLHHNLYTCVGTIARMLYRSLDQNRVTSIGPPSAVVHNLEHAWFFTINNSMQQIQHTKAHDTA